MAIAITSDWEKFIGHSHYLKLESELETIATNFSRNHEAFKVACIAGLLKANSGKPTKTWGAFMTPYHFMGDNGEYSLQFCYYPDLGFLTTSHTVPHDLVIPERWSMCKASLRMISTNVYSSSRLIKRSNLKRPQYQYDLLSAEKLDKSIANSLACRINECYDFRILIEVENSLFLSCNVELLMITECGDIKARLSAFCAPPEFLRSPLLFSKKCDDVINLYNTKMRPPWEFAVDYKTIKQAYQDKKWKPIIDVKDVCDENISEQLLPLTIYPELKDQNNRINFHYGSQIEKNLQTIAVNISKCILVCT